MGDVLVVLFHSIVTVVRLNKTGDLAPASRKSTLTRHHLLVLNRSRKRVPACVIPIALSPVYAPISYAALRYCLKAIHASRSAPDIDTALAHRCAILFVDSLAAIATKKKSLGLTGTIARSKRKAVN